MIQQMSGNYLIPVIERVFPLFKRYVEFTLTTHVLI